MQLRPRWAQATAVDPRPRNGSATVRMRSTPCSRRHISGSRGGNVAGCGRSLSRLWMVSYGMKHVLPRQGAAASRSEEHTSELQSLRHLVCRLLLEKKKISEA